MEYPGSKFTRPWRVLMLSVFLLAFFVISPLLILYSSGFRYDYKNGIVHEVGVISIDILPTSAIVYLNDEKLSGTIPIRLKNVIPGKYKIRLTADGFYDWEKEVDVENKQTVYVKEIKLIKKSNPVKIVDGKINKLYLSADNNYLIFEKTNTSKEYWIRNISTDTDKLLIKVSNEKEYLVNWHKENSFAYISSLDNSEIYILDASNSSKYWALPSTEDDRVLKIQWNDSGNNLLFSKKDGIFTVDPITRQISLISNNLYSDWFVYGGKLWTIQKNIKTNQIDITKDTFGFSSKFAELGSQTYSDINAVKFVGVGEDSVLLKKSAISEMTLLSKNKEFTFSGDNLLKSDFNNWWIMWSPWEITTYSTGEEPFLLNRSGETLRKVIVLDEYNTLGLIWSDKMTALFPYYFVNHNLINNKINDAVANPKLRTLYFSGNTNGQDGLWQLQY